MIPLMIFAGFLATAAVFGLGWWLGGYVPIPREKSDV
jgi:hypothetical protein